MKRDMSLIRKILEAYEERDDFVTKVTPVIEGYTHAQVCYHIKLMGEYGLLEVSDWSSNTELDWVASSLTAYGHDFLDMIRQETIWETIQSEFKDASLETVISVAKQMAENWAKRKLENIFGSS